MKKITFMEFLIEQGEQPSHVDQIKAALYDEDGDPRRIRAVAKAMGIPDQYLPSIDGSYPPIAFHYRIPFEMKDEFKQDANNFLDTIDTVQWNPTSKTWSVKTRLPLDQATDAERKNFDPSKLNDKFYPKYEQYRVGNKFLPIDGVVQFKNDFKSAIESDPEYKSKLEAKENSTSTQWSGSDKKQWTVQYSTRENDYNRTTVSAKDRNDAIRQVKARFNPTKVTSAVSF